MPLKKPLGTAKSSGDLVSPGVGFCRAGKENRRTPPKNPQIFTLHKLINIFSNNEKSKSILLSTIIDNQLNK